MTVVMFAIIAEVILVAIVEHIVIVEDVFNIVTKSQKKYSEFGKGLVYNLGLFLAHAERLQRERSHQPDEEKVFAELWFNSASDHLYEMECPDNWQWLKRRVMELRKKALRWGHGFPSAEKDKPTWKDVDWAIKDAKEILRHIDKNVFMIKSVKGEWE